MLFFDVFQHLPLFVPLCPLPNIIFNLRPIIINEIVFFFVVFFVTSCWKVRTPDPCFNWGKGTGFIKEFTTSVQVSFGSSTIFII